MTTGAREPRRVALVTGQLDWGGAERQLFLYATELASRGLSVEVGCLSSQTEPYGPRLAAAEIPVRVFARRSAFDAGRVLGVRRWLRRYASDIVVSFGEFAAVYVDLALSFTRRQPPHLAMLRRSALQFSGPRRSLVRRAFRRAELVAANSEAGRAYGTRELGLDPASVTVLRNVVPREILDLVVDRVAVRRELNLPPDEPIVCYVGRLARAKDIPTLCLTLRQLDEADVRHTALVIGPDLDRQPAGHPDAGRRTRWLGVRADAVRLVAASDVLLLTSRSEGTPNVVLESLAVGTPVVSTRVGDVSSVVEAPGAGLLADPGDHQALGTAITSLFADRAEARRMGERGRAFVGGTFGPGRAVDDFLDLLRAATVART